MLEGVVIFSGVTLPGPPLGPAHAPEGDVFSGTSLAGASSGGSNLGSGGTVFPPGPGTPTPAPPSTTLTLTAVPSAIIAAFQRYSQYSLAYGGIPPYNYSIVSGALPSGTELDTSNGDVGNIAQVFGYPTEATSFTYTVEVTDSSGVVSFTTVGGGTYSGTGANPNDGVAGSITTPGDDQLLMIVCVTGTDGSVTDPNEVTTIVTSDPSLILTRVFHDGSFTYTDSTSDSENPVASFSIDIFTAPVPTQIQSSAPVNWHGTMSGSGVSRGSAFVLSVGGLKNINSPFDPSGSLPNVAMNTSGTSSAPSNTNVITTFASDAVFSVIINHDTAGDNTPVPPPGFTTIGSIPNAGLASGFSLLLSYLSVSEIQSDVTITAQFSDNFWYSAILAVEGTGGIPNTAQQTVSGTVSPVVAGSQTLSGAGSTGYFFAPPYNTLTIDVYGGSETGSQIIGTFGGVTSADPNGFATITYTPETALAPPVTGAMPYTIGTGSPAGEIVITWS